MLRLWGRLSSINVRKVVLAAQLLQLRFERIDAGMAFGIVQTPEYKAQNPNALVPLLDDDGFTLWESNVIVRYLGANVPHDDLIKSVVSEKPDVVGLSVTMSFNVPQLRTAVERVRAITETPILIGGHATRWSQNLAFDLYVDSAGNTPEELIEVARRLAGVTP